MSVGYQSFYQGQLTSNITDTDLTIPLDAAPTPDEGFLVIESTIVNKREIIYYTSKTSNSVTCPADGRGYDSTTATSHLQGASVIMAPVGAMFSELREQFTTTPQGWTSVVPTISTVTHNGNRSYDVAFASTVASTLSPGMRLEFTKTVAGNGYMGGAFNGSSHYFTKATPSGTLGTVTNNFTIEAVVQPTSYQAGWIAARNDAAGANGFGLQMNASGQLSAVVYSGGAGNYRYILSYQSLQLNKKTHVAMSWTGGTVVIYIDGVSVLVAAAVTAGTAPTTAGTGGDFSIGRKGGAAEYFPGYISNVAVFDAVLSAATIKDHSTRKLLGSETNCIGAWSLDNTANDQSSAGNNLTATGGVGYTAMTPHGQLGNGVETTKAVGLVMAVSGSTVTVQCPEGVTIPTTGGITSVAYSTQANPFGWVDDKGRWKVIALFLARVSGVATTVGTYYNYNNYTKFPIGAWEIGYSSFVQVTNAGASGVAARVTLSTANNSESDVELTCISSTGQPSSLEYDSLVLQSASVSLSVATTYYLNASPLVSNSTIYIGQGAAPYPTKIYATPAGL